MENIVKWRKRILSPVPGSPWACEMVLNPAIIQDPKTGRIHMLFRATGPWEQAQLPGRPYPYPIFLGYAYSDNGEDFEFDLDRPALAPAVCYDKDGIYTTNIKGEKVVDFANGCIEDPRFFYIEDECYISTACRMFPPGPYWDWDWENRDDDCYSMPDWALQADNPYATQENPTVNVLYKVDLDALSKKDYDNAFCYVTELTNPVHGEDRDLFFFPRKMKVKGEMCYVMLHRPHRPDEYGLPDNRPCILISAAKELEDFAKDNCVDRQIVLAPDLDWQAEKVGGSTPPIELGDGKWLFNYHGKQDIYVGYAQSFMILKEQEDGMPIIDKICNEGLIVNEEPFEAPSKYPTPCVFFTGMIPYKGDLLVSYGAADEHVGIMLVDREKVMKILENC